MTDDLASDLLRGAEAIAAFTGESERQIYDAAHTKRLPIWKAGKGKKAALIASKSTLRAHYRALEAKAIAATQEVLARAS
jgi:hypothetical protein